MRLTAVLVLTAALVLPAAAAKNMAKDAVENAPGIATAAPPGPVPVDEVYRAFDMFGSWAVDCGRPPSLDNPYVNVTSPGAGLVLENNDVGPGYAVNSYSVFSAGRLSKNRMEATVIFQPGAPGQERQLLVFEIRKGKRRTIYNRAEGGDVRVKNGIVLSRGVKTPVLTKCG